MKKYVLRKVLGSDFKFQTRQNYEAYISDARAVHTFTKRDGFNTFDDVLEFVEKWFKVSRDNIDIIK